MTLTVVTIDNAHGLFNIICNAGINWPDKGARAWAIAPEYQKFYTCELGNRQILRKNYMNIYLAIIKHTYFWRKTAQFRLLLALRHRGPYVYTGAQAGTPVHFRWKSVELDGFVVRRSCSPANHTVLGEATGFLLQRLIQCIYDNGCTKCHMRVAIVG